MPINIFVEEVLPFAQAAKRLPPTRGGRPVSPATLWRWTSHGLRGVKLESVRQGGTRVTSIEALQRFFAALDGKPAAEPQSPVQSSARGELAELGI